MWNLPGPGFKPMSPALAGGFLSIVPPEKSFDIVIISKIKEITFNLVEIKCVFLHLIDFFPCKCFLWQTIQPLKLMLTYIYWHVLHLCNENVDEIRVDKCMMAGCHSSAFIHGKIFFPFEPILLNPDKDVESLSTQYSKTPPLISEFKHKLNPVCHHWSRWFVRLFSFIWTCELKLRPQSGFF